MSLDYTIDTERVKRLVLKCSFPAMILALFFALLILVIVWLSALTYLFRRLITNYRILTNDGSKKTLDVVISSIIRELQVQKKTLAELHIQCDRIEKEETFHIQKIGLLRFNPFNDTGGDQSFIITLIDAHETGIVLTALYSRSGTRWYAKKIVEGKGLEHELSEEEKKAVKTAKDLPNKNISNF